MESEWKLKLTPLARTDLEEIYQYISICLDAPQAADRLMTAFEKSFEQLQNHPFSFPRANDESLSKQKKWSSCAFSMARGITNDCCEKKK